MINGCIYYIIDPEGYYYFGSTLYFQKRMSSHYCSLYTKKMLTKAYNQFRKFEWDDLIKEIVEEGEYESREKLYMIESEYIFNSRNDPLCLNVVHNPGADLSYGQMKKWRPGMKRARNKR